MLCFKLANSSENIGYGRWRTLYVRIRFKEHWQYTAECLPVETNVSPYIYICMAKLDNEYISKYTLTVLFLVSM